MNKFAILFLLFFSVSVSSQVVHTLEVTQSSPEELELYAFVEMFTITNVLSENISIVDNNITIDLCYFATILLEHDYKQHNFIIPISASHPTYQLNFRIFVESELDPLSDCSTLNPNYDEIFEIKIPLDGTVPLNITDKKSIAPIVIYPNPVKDQFFIRKEIDFITNKVLLYNIHGQLVKQFSNTNYFDVSNLPTGLYILKVDLEGKKYVSKFIKD